MKKIKHYTGKTLAFYEEVRDSKREEANKASLEAIHEIVKSDYEAYDKAFAAMQLHMLLPDKALNEENRSKLLSLYKYNAAPLQKLLNKLTTDEYNHVDDACPYCNVNTASTFDHILPKSAFQEYAVHPLNLIPCCPKCNGHKSTAWKQANSLKYLNLYQDDLPNVQYLFVKFTITDGLPLAKFYVQNTNNINPALYARIEATYRDMKLCRLYQRRCTEEICEISMLIKQGITRGTSVEQVKSELLEDVHDKRQRKGYNYWKAILKEAICNDSNAFQCLSATK